MEFDVFFSISQTPDAAGTFPDETTMYSNYLEQLQVADELGYGCLLYTSPSPRDLSTSRMPSSA